MQWYLRVALFTVFLSASVVESIDVINVLIHPTISDEEVTTSIALTCAAYYVNNVSYGQDVDVLWYFVKESSQNDTVEPLLITANTRLSTGRLMFEIPEESRNSTLYFIGASAEYNGEYYCVVVKNELTAQSKSAIYKFGGNNSTIFVVEPSFSNLNQSSNQTLTCQTADLPDIMPDPPDIQWYYNPDNTTKYNIGNKEYAPHNLNFYNIHSERHKSVLELVYASSEYNGEYYCIAKFGENQQASSRSAMYLYSAGDDDSFYPFKVAIAVKVLGKIMKYASDFETAEGQYQDNGLAGSVTFVCQEVTFSDLRMVDTNYKWIYHPFDEEGAITIETNDMYNIINNGESSELQLRYSSDDYLGRYQCVVYGTLEDGQQTYSVSKEFVYIYTGRMEKPKFLDTPEFEVDPVSKLVTKSGVSLTCRASQPAHYPPVEIKWYRGSSSDKLERIEVPPTGEKFKSMYKLSEDKTVLTFLTYSSYNNGTYHCEATNSMGKVTSPEVLYQYGDYITMSQRGTADGMLSLICNYTNANTAADTSHVTWWRETEEGAWEQAEGTVTDDNSTSISTLTFKMKIEDARLYKCLFTKQSKGKEKWAYGFYRLYLCSMKDTSATVQHGDPITLSCSCVVQMGANTSFLFYKDKISELDQDIFEKYSGTPDVDRLQFKGNATSASLVIPYARAIDAGHYECGYELDDSERKFAVGSTNITFQGFTEERVASPFGFGYYNVTVGAWQPIFEKIDPAHDFEKEIPQLNTDLMDIQSFYTYPNYLGAAVQSYGFQYYCEDVSQYGVQCTSFFFFLTESREEGPVEDMQALHWYISKAGAEELEPLPDKATVKYDIQYNLAEGATAPPSYFPADRSLSFIFPEYKERVVAPYAEYVVLSTGFNDKTRYDPATFPYANYIGCKHCMISGDGDATKHHCPWPSGKQEDNIYPTWKFNGDAMQFVNDTGNFMEDQAEMKLFIQHVETSMAGVYECTYSYTDKIYERPVESSATQELIVEGDVPLKPDHGVELPLHVVSNSTAVLVTYADIWMSRSLYHIVSVRWGVVHNETTVEWLPPDSRQTNDWQTKRLKYRIQTAEDKTYICNVTYLDRTMAIYIPVVSIDVPSSVSNLTYEYDPILENITFSWTPSQNADNNYFRGYQVTLTKRSLNSDNAVSVNLPMRSYRDATVTLPGDVAPYCQYNLTVTAEYEYGASLPEVIVFESPEAVPGAPKNVIVETQDQKLDGEFTFVFSLIIKPPAVAKGIIIGYKIEFYSNTTLDNMTRRKRRQLSGQPSTWTTDLRADTDPNFTPNGGYNGTVSLNISDGFSSVNRIRVTGRTSAGEGEPFDTSFTLIQALFAKGGSGAWVYVVIAIAIIFIICLAIAVFCYMKRHQQVKKIIKTQYNPLYPMMRSVVPDQWEVNPDDMKLSTGLGEGAFGRVMKGALMKDGKTLMVAVKMLKEEAYSEQEAEALWKEIALMKKVGSHPSIVNIIGCVTVKAPVCLLVEYVANGDLQSYLRSIRAKFEKEHSRNIRTISSNMAKSATSRKSKQANGNTSDQDSDPLLRATPPAAATPSSSLSADYVNIKSPDAAYINLQGLDTEEKAEILTSGRMLNMMYQIACGMQYLSFKNIIHRDLAARNILVGEDMSVKVSDFGLARDMYLEGQYMMNPRGRVPFKWMSPEALFDLKFTSKSDVWSYGVLLWEIVTLGGSPYPGIEPAKLYKLLRKGYRMARPEGCSLEIYDIMKDCWQEDPDLRPPFNDLSQTIQKLMDLDSEDYLTVGQGIASIVESDDEAAIELHNDEVEVQPAEQYSAATCPAEDSSSSDLDNNPRSPLLSNNSRADKFSGPIPRADTLNFPTGLTTGDDSANRYSNFSESCL